MSAHDLDAYRWVVSNRSELLPFEERLQRLGVDYVFGYDDAVSHFREYGRRYQNAILFYPSIAHQYTPIIRIYCPNAKIIFDTGDLHACGLSDLSLTWSRFLNTVVYSLPPCAMGPE